MISRADYLAQDAQSDQKLEFFEGQIFAMAGGTFKHAQVAGNVYGELRQALKGKPCQPMNSDMRVHTPSGLDTYPDISVYCGKASLNTFLQRSASQGMKAKLNFTWVLPAAGIAKGEKSPFVLTTH